MKTAFAVAFAAVLCLLQGGVQAQDQFERQVRDQILSAAKSYEAQGFSLSRAIIIGSLDDNREQEHELVGNIGREYVVIGRCDNDCSDLDLWLYDGAGEVDSDVASDDVPLVSAVIRRSGTMRVKVGMITCSANPCRYGLGVFEK